MDDLAKMVIEHACERLVNSYANLLDAYEYDAFMDLWAEDAVLNMLGREHAGIDAIRGWLQTREPDMICRHMVTNFVVDVLDGMNAKGSCYTISYRVQGWLGRDPGPLEAPTFLVQYRDRFQLSADRGWVFARRDVVANMVGEEQMRMLRDSGLAAASGHRTN
jgi:SnoaL-like domain